MAPDPRPIPRFIADTSQEGIPHGRFAARLREEFVLACDAIADLPADTEVAEEVDWFPERAWGGRVWVPRDPMDKRNVKLSQARAEQVQSKTDIFTSYADLVNAIGTDLPTPGVPQEPSPAEEGGKNQYDEPK